MIAWPRRWLRALRQLLTKGPGFDSWPTLRGNWTDWEAGGIREPTIVELLAAYRDTAYYCANLNARGVARVPLRLLVRTEAGQPRPRCVTRAIEPRLRRRLECSPTFRNAVRKAMAVEEVLEHPLIDLLRNPCCDGKVPLLNQFDLFELTQLYQELTGRAYWYIEHDGLGRPRAIWILDPQQVRPIQRRGSERVIDGYEVGRGADRRLYAPEEVIGFRVPDPLDPQLGGFSPLAAVFERIHVTRRYLSQTRAILENRARPDAVISPSHPDGVIGEAEAKRLEASFNQRFRGSGAGGVLVAKDSLRIEPLSFNPKDLGELAENQVSFEHIARAFDIPLALLHRDVNRASAEQGRLQHAKDAILPRITRLQEQLNQRLVPLYDTTGRLFLAFDDPVPENVELELRIRESNLRLGVTTINEERAALGLEPVGE